MEVDIQKIKAFIFSQIGDDEVSDESYTEMASERLNDILTSAKGEIDDGKYGIMLADINSFMSGGDAQKGKLLAYCMDFDDPTERGDNVQLVRYHSFLDYSELEQLYQFIQKHKKDGSFAATVDKITKAHGKKRTDVYKKALIDRRDFARVTDYKNTSVSRYLAWQIAVGLECSMEEARELLYSAGYVPRDNRLDLVMEYFITHENYDIMAINVVLDELGIKPFSCAAEVKDKN